MAYGSPKQSIEYGIIGEPASFTTKWNHLELGWSFDVGSEDIDVLGLRIKMPDVQTSNGNLWLSDGTLLKTVEITAIAEEWSEAYFDEPITLVSGNIYVISFYNPGNRYQESASSFVFNSKITYVSGHYGSTQGSFPADKESDGLYPVVDIIIRNGGEPDSEPEEPENHISYYLTETASLTAVANAIRAKTGSADSLAFPSGMVEAISGFTGGEDLDAELATQSEIIDQIVSAIENKSVGGGGESGGGGGVVSRLYSFTGADMLQANIATGQGYLTSEGKANAGDNGSLRSYYFVAEILTRLIYANNKTERLTATEKKSLIVDFKLKDGVNATCQYAIWFIHSSGANKINGASESTKYTLDKNKDCTDTGWIDLGTAINVPEDCKFFWINFRKADNATITPDELEYLDVWQVSV